MPLVLLLYRPHEHNRKTKDGNGTYPLVTTNPYPCPRRENMSFKKPIPTDGYRYMPILVPKRVMGTRGLPVPDKLQASMSI